MALETFVWLHWQWLVLFFFCGLFSRTSKERQIQCWDQKLRANPRGRLSWRSWAASFRSCAGSFTSRTGVCGASLPRQPNAWCRTSTRYNPPSWCSCRRLVEVMATSDVTDCLATHITDAIRRAHNNSKALKLNLHDFATSSGKAPDVLKLELDDMLSSSFTSGNKAGLLYNIQDLPSRTAMLFHSYCDNENAPFKDITITFTVKIDANSQQTYTNDEEIEGYFYKLWSNLDRDTLSPLLSRVANSIAVVRREDEQVMEQHCK